MEAAETEIIGHVTLLTWQCRQGIPLVAWYFFTHYFAHSLIILKQAEQITRGYDCRKANSGTQPAPDQQQQR